MPDETRPPHPKTPRADIPRAGPPSSKRQLLAHSQALAYSDEQREFLQAVDRYKRVNHRPHPTWQEVLEIVRALGYRKVPASQAVILDAVSVKACTLEIASQPQPDGRVLLGRTIDVRLDGKPLALWRRITLTLACDDVAKAEVEFLPTTRAG